MKIFVIGQDWFVDDFRKMGHEVVTAGTRDHLQYKLEFPIENVNDLFKRTNFYPDLLLVLDESTALTIAGVEDLKIPTVFYSVDTHHHYEVHRQLTKAFDLVYVAHKDYIDLVKTDLDNVKWLPLFASRYMDASAEKEYGAVFVGTLNPKLNPDRVEFFNALQKEADVLVTSGDFSTIFPKSEIVINQTVKKDLNFRVFETMMSGALLLTEDTNNGLHDLFRDGQHLVTYRKNDVQDAAAKINYYLTHKEEAHKIAKAGRDEILRAHCQSQRAETILSDVAKISKKNKKERYLAFVPNYVWGANLIQNKSEVDSAKFFEQSLKNIELAYNDGEIPSEDVAPYIVVSCLKFDEIVHVVLGENILKQYSEKFLDMPFFLVCYITAIYNKNRKEEALKLIKDNFSGIDPDVIIRNGNEILGSLLALCKQTFSA